MVQWLKWYSYNSEHEDISLNKSENNNENLTSPKKKTDIYYYDFCKHKAL